MSKEKEINFTVRPGGSFNGEIRVPGDKSISHRAVMLGSLAEGETHVTGLLEGDDVLATLNAFRAMGVKAPGPENGELTIAGVGLDGLQPPSAPLDMGNSGTAMRLMAGILVGQKFDSELIGDASLNKRPMNRVAQPLAKMAARIDTQEGGTPPLKISGGADLKGINYPMPVASAQVKSALLLAGLYAKGETTVIEPAPTRDHTERMLQGFGYQVVKDGAESRLKGGGKLTACDIDVPADISSAAFFMVGASIASGSELLLLHVGINPTRIGIVNILRKMGADISVENERVVGGEPVADLRVRSAQLQGIHIPEDQVPLAIDEFPVLFIAAACAEGTTVLTGARELRVKESDRIAVMAEGLTRLGITVQETDDGIVIEGGQLMGGEVDSHDDHRIAMAFAIAGLRATDVITIRDCRNVSTSFPNFVSLARQAGSDIEVAH
ncbi:MAG: 3-phosphoshikimate 1-carboxyvinyltransferase [Acidiferrobacterales bacterium]